MWVEHQAKLSIERAQRERAEADLNTMQRDAASALDTMVELQVENEKLRQQAESKPHEAQHARMHATHSRSCTRVLLGVEQRRTHSHHRWS